MVDNKYFLMALISWIIFSIILVILIILSVYRILVEGSFVIEIISVIFAVLSMASGIISIGLILFFSSNGKIYIMIFESCLIIVLVMCAWYKINFSIYISFVIMCQFLVNCIIEILIAIWVDKSCFISSLVGLLVFLFSFLYFAIFGIKVIYNFYFRQRR